MREAIVAVAVLVSVAAGIPRGHGDAPKGVALADLTWPDAEPWLTPSTVVVIPLGAGALEQGPHMKLNSDERLARYLASRVQASSAAVIAPSLAYHAYSAYAAYPGSTSLTDTTARDLTAGAVRSLARFGPRRFYVLNTSPSTLGALSTAAKALSEGGILLGYTDPDYWTKGSSVLRQRPIGAGHAEEAATSMMLFVDPAAVDMKRATREYAPGRGPLVRDSSGNGVPSKSGTLGDATLATAEKGKVLVDALVAGILDDIEKVRSAPLPAIRATAPAPPPAPTPARAAVPQEHKGPGGCTDSDDRAIRNVGAKFTTYWANQMPIELSNLFTPNGDMRHPDGSIERGRETIRSNRANLFTRHEYDGSKHPVDLADVRCLGTDTAIADGKWELRLQDRPQTTPGRGLSVAKNNAGLCTLIMVKTDGDWFIEAWRYTLNPQEGPPAPIFLSKPGYPGRGGGL